MAGTDLRTALSYRDGLRARPRSVWIDGDEVADVTSDHRLSVAIATIASIFELHSLPRLQATVTTALANGRVVPLSLSPPASPANLEHRRVAAGAIAEENLGFVGRSQEFMNSVLGAFASSADWFSAGAASRADNVISCFDRVCRDQPYIVHAAIDPPRNRSASDSALVASFGPLRVVDRNRAGLVVRGAKLVATGAALADEIAVFPLPGLREDDDESRTCAFCIPVESHGLHLLLRSPAVLGEVPPSRYPLAARFQEVDCVCVFDDVLVPGDRVFFDGAVAQANALYDETGARALTAHRDLTRAAVKLRFMAGLAVLLARSAEVDTHLHVQEMLGEVVGMAATVEAAVIGSQRQPTFAQADAAAFGPDPRVLLALRYRVPMMFTRVAEVIQAVGGASLLVVPSGRSAAGEVESLASTIFRGGDEAIDRQLLLAIARDATTSEYGQRQLLFERNHAGDPVRLSAANYLGWADDSAEMVNRFLRHAQSTEQGT